MADLHVENVLKDSTPRGLGFYPSPFFSSSQTALHRAPDAGSSRHHRGVVPERFEAGNDPFQYGQVAFRMMS